MLKVVLNMTTKTQLLISYSMNYYSNIDILQQRHIMFFLTMYILVQVL